MFLQGVQKRSFEIEKLFCVVGYGYKNNSCTWTGNLNEHINDKINIAIIYLYIFSEKTSSN